MNRIVIDGKGYEVEEEVAQLILDISKERDELKLKLDPSSVKVTKETWKIGINDTE
jgi:hypothetical protein